MSGLKIALLAAVGFFAGVFGTMIGIGGGVIFVPVFLLFFNFTPQQTIGTSLAVSSLMLSPAASRICDRSGLISGRGGSLP